MKRRRSSKEAWRLAVCVMVLVSQVCLGLAVSCISIGKMKAERTATCEEMLHDANWSAKERAMRHVLLYAPWMKFVLLEAGLLCSPNFRAHLRSLAELLPIAGCNIVGLLGWLRMRTTWGWTTTGGPFWLSAWALGRCRKWWKRRRRCRVGTEAEACCFLFAM